MTTLNSELCARLQQRLRDAEKHAHAALEQSSDKADPLHEATLELLDAHREIRDMLNEHDLENSSKLNDPEVEVAAVEVGREEHEHKAEIKDILKAIFMWRDDPAERAQRS
ncbi:MAG: hypothetical protein R3242_02330 [Akkermansiaceae bacterium]|nr:hypothetical protein [Akkermansiaceae bacterium]